MTSKLANSSPSIGLTVEPRYRNHLSSFFTVSRNNPLSTVFIEVERTDWLTF